MPADGRQVVWVGDFNFRLAGLTREAAVGLVVQARGLLYQLISI